MSAILERIVERYQADQAREFIPQHREDLPLSYAAITNEWLTSVLCANAPGAVVVDHELMAPDNGSSNRMRIRVSYNEAGVRAHLPEALFCKASHDLSNRIALGVSGAAHSEVTFYEKIRPRLSIEAPTAFYANYCPQSFNSMIILADLTDTAQEFCSHNTRITRSRVQSQLRLLAKLHGAGYADHTIRDASMDLQTWEDWFAGTLTFGLKEGHAAGFLAAKDVIPPALFERDDEIWPAVLASVARHGEGARTIAHGDVHLKNWYIAGDGEMGLGDWQCCSRANWARDVAYTLSTALTVEDRRNWERDLLAIYVRDLHLAGGPRIDMAEAWIHYRQQLMTALAWWTFTLCPPPGLPDMQPREVTLEFIRRIATAMDDVDSLGAFTP